MVQDSRLLNAPRGIAKDMSLCLRVIELLTLEGSSQEAIRHLATIFVSLIMRLIFLEMVLITFVRVNT